jgi:16S rRNA (cytidine1402-2'-O)-methyltransferase
VGGDDGEGERVLKLLLDEGLPTKQAAKLASAITGAAKNALYEKALALKS